MNIKEHTYNNTTSLIFEFDLLYKFNLIKMLNLLKISSGCMEIYYVDNYNSECISYLKNHKIDFLKVPLNKYQSKLIINFDVSNVIYLENIEKMFSEFEFEEISLWDKKIIHNCKLDNQLKDSNLYLNFNSQDNNSIELIYNIKQYKFLNKLYLQKNLL